MTGAGLHLIVRLAGERVALPAAEIDSVVEIDAPTPIPLAPPHVAGLAALRSRVLTVIDGATAVGTGDFGIEGAMEAVMLEHDGHAYAVRVDGVEDVVEIGSPIEPPPALLAPAWARVARGIVRHDEASLLVVSPAALIAGPATVVNSALTPAA